MKKSVKNVAAFVKEKKYN